MAPGKPLPHAIFQLRLPEPTWYRPVRSPGTGMRFHGQPDINGAPPPIMQRRPIWDPAFQKLKQASSAILHTQGTYGHIADAANRG